MAGVPAEDESPENPCLAKTAKEVNVVARPRAWADTGVTQLITGTQFTVDLLPVPESVTVTSMRVIGSFLLVPNDPNAAITGTQAISVGIGVVSAEAFAAGVVPDPSVNGDFPARGWIYRTTRGEHHNNAGGTIEGWSYPEWQFDVGGMRKIDRGKIFLAVDKILLSGSAHNLDMIGLVRVLCLN